MIKCREMRSSVSHIAVSLLSPKALCGVSLGLYAEESETLDINCPTCELFERHGFLKEDEITKSMGIEICKAMEK